MKKLLKPLAIILGLGVLGGLVGGGAALMMKPAQALAQPVESGPRPDADVPGLFDPVNYNGPDAGKKQCQYCKNGENPVVMIFARTLNDQVTQLIKKLDAATIAHADAQMGSCVIFLSNDRLLPDRLKELAAREKIEHTILCTHTPAGPPNYKISRDADITVLLYTNYKVKSNYSFGKGQWPDGEIDTILGDLPKILAKEGAH